MALVIATLFVGIHCNVQHFNCEFQMRGFTNAQQFYTCIVSRFSNPNNDVQIIGLTGIHMINRNDNSVQAIYIQDPNTRFLPSNLGIFSNLEAFGCADCRLNEISADRISGMRNLQSIDFRTNNLISVPANLFSGLPRLRTVFLNNNRIAALPPGLLGHNIMMEYFNMMNNLIQLIAPGTFDGKPNLHSVLATNNICLNRNFIGGPAISEMRQFLSTMCRNI